MPTSPEESVRKDVLYPDDLPGEGFVIREYQYYDAQEDADDLPDDAKFGTWLPVTWMRTGDPDVFITAPRELRETLLDEGAEEGDAFRVLEVEKGPKDHDPYSVDIEYPFET